MSAMSKYFKTHNIDRSKADCEFKEFANASSGKLILQQTMEKQEKMSRDSPQAAKIMDALTQYVSLNNQPLSVVDNTGIQLLLCVLEPMYDSQPSPHHGHSVTKAARLCEKLLLLALLSTHIGTRPWQVPTFKARQLGLEKNSYQQHTTLQRLVACSCTSSV